MGEDGQLCAYGITPSTHVYVKSLGSTEVKDRRAGGKHERVQAREVKDRGILPSDPRGSKGRVSRGMSLDPASPWEV